MPQKIWLITQSVDHVIDVLYGELNQQYSAKPPF